MPVVTGMPVEFCLPFACWLGCHALHYAMRMGCVVPAAFGTMEGGKEVGLCSFLELGYHFCLWPKYVAYQEPAGLHHYICMLCFQRWAGAGVQPGV